MKTNEEKWIARLEVLARSKPKSLCVHTTDGNLIVCKKGISSSEFCHISKLYVYGGAMLSDIHDNADCGKG